MRHLVIGAGLAVILAGCGQSENTPQNSAAVSDDKAAPAPPSPSVSVPPNDAVTITAEALLSEEAACVIPLRISNGTEAEISVSMFGFAVTGDGQDDTGNMFPQVVPPRQYQTARIIQIGQSCAAFDTITPRDVLCKTDGQDCEVIFEDSPEMAFKTASR